jgi:hypothetical protein
MMTVMDVHPRDLTILFSGLVEKGIIYQEGAGRGTIYFLSEARNNDMVDLLFDDISGGQGASSGGLGVSSGGLKESSGGLKVLEAIAEVVASRKKSPKLVVEKTILSLCKRQELTLDELADLLNRSNESIRKDYLQPMIKDKRLRYRYPTLPNHPDQAYATNDSEEKG